MSVFIQTRKALVRHFGEDQHINGINAGDADEWAAVLRKDYAPATVATFVKKARQMFRHAVRKRLLQESPFAAIRAFPGEQVARRVCQPGDHRPSDRRGPGP